MSYRGRFLRAWLFGAVMLLGAGFAGKAFASDPLPGDSIGLPPDINVGILYSQFAGSGDFSPAHGAHVPHSKVTDVVSYLRYVRTFGIDGYTAGAQIVIPYVAFLGPAKVGGNKLPTNSGFTQPQLGVFAFPINDDADGRSAVVGAWIGPAISSFNKNYVVNPSENLTTYEGEAGFHQILFGDPKGSNLALEAWDEIYYYTNNTNFGPRETFREQPADEVRVYLNYLVDPKIGLFVSPGFFQSFGGKQTVAIQGTPIIVDTGNRSNISELRFAAGTFLSPTFQVMAVGQYDVAGHGGFLSRSVVLRLVKFF